MIDTRADQRFRDAISAVMTANGWPLIALSGLPPVYAKDDLVTPYFLFSGARKRPYGSYAIGGIIGVIHQGFEARWAQSRPDSRGGLAIQLNILNVIELLKLRYVHPGEQAEAEVHSFCIAMVNTLESLPQTQEQLVGISRRGALLDRPLSVFGGLSQKEKCRAFWDFIGQLPSGHGNS